MPSWDPEDKDDVIIDGGGPGPDESAQVSNEFVTDPTQFRVGKKPKQNEEEHQEEDKSVEKAVLLDSAIDSSPAVDHTFDDSDLQDSSEYGYGTWLRYLTTYPEKHIMD